MGKRKLLKSIGRKENKRLENHKRMERTIQLQKSFAFLSTALAFDSAGAIQIAASNHLSSFTLSASTKKDDCQEHKRRIFDTKSLCEQEVDRYYFGGWSPAELQIGRGELFVCCDNDMRKKSIFGSQCVA